MGHLRLSFHPGDGVQSGARPSSKEPSAAFRSAQPFHATARGSFFFDHSKTTV
jgi:hypothetical protein